MGRWVLVAPSLLTNYYLGSGLLEYTMGHARPRPKHLAAKLLQIRQRLGLSQPKLTTIRRHIHIESKY